MSCGNILCAGANVMVLIVNITFNKVSETYSRPSFTRHFLRSPFDKYSRTNINCRTKESVSGTSYSLSYTLFDTVHAGCVISGP